VWFVSNGNTDDLRLVLEVISAAGLVAVSWITLTVKNAVQQVKNTQIENKFDLMTGQNKVVAELIQSQNAAKDELSGHNAAMRTELAVHTAIDDQRFKDLNGSVVRIEATLDRMEKNGRYQPRGDKN
jgi:hypothetical protein